MASTQERDELRRLADELPDDAVHNVLQFIEANGERLKRGSKTTDSGETSQARDVSPARERPAWIGAGRLGPDFASSAKDVLRDEMGQRKA